MGSGPGFQTGDVGIIATLGPLGTFPSVRTSDGQGTAKQAASTAARDLIDSGNRCEGMTCWVTGTGELYRLVGGIANANWILEASIGGGSALIRSFVAGVVANDVVYNNGTSNTVARADAGAVATGLPLGICRAINSPVLGQCIVVPIGDLTGFAGLTIGGRYILGAAPGAIVLESDTGNANYPSTTPGSGEVISPVGIAATATVLSVTVGAGIVFQF